MDEPDERVRTWYFASSNNVIVSGDTVWLPRFGYGTWAELAATDEANAQIWCDLGYQVVFAGESPALAENLGGLHYLTKCLARG